MIVIVGYSGHACVAIETFSSMGLTVGAYCETAPKSDNPYQLEWLGSEQDEATAERMASADYFVGIGDGMVRMRVQQELQQRLGRNPLNAIHARAIVSSSVTMGAGLLVGAGAVINAQARIGEGAICNTASVIEHHCVISPYAHIAPGAILCGGVFVGEGSLVGAGAIIKPQIRIGRNVIIGAGTVVLRDVPDNTVLVGNPGTPLIRK
jgi:sugar O-acyltransferase (sialic acid O-acetyltransferase NeuD family)